MVSWYDSILITSCNILFFIFLKGEFADFLEEHLGVENDENFVSADLPDFQDPTITAAVDSVSSRLR